MEKREVHTDSPEFKRIVQETTERLANYIDSLNVNVGVQIEASMNLLLAAYVRALTMDERNVRAVRIVAAVLNRATEEAIKQRHELADQLRKMKDEKQQQQQLPQLPMGKLVEV